MDRRISPGSFSDRTWVHSRRATTVASCFVVCGRIRANSSPPTRAPMSMAREELAMTRATALSASSPCRCPYTSLTRLKLSISSTSRDSGWENRCARPSSRWRFSQKARVLPEGPFGGQARTPVGQGQVPGLLIALRPVDGQGRQGGKPLEHFLHFPGKRVQFPALYVEDADQLAVQERRDGKLGPHVG